MRGACNIRHLAPALMLVLAACTQSGASAPIPGSVPLTPDSGSTRPCPKDAIPPGDYGHVITKANVPPGQQLLVGYWIATATGVTDPNCYFPLFFTEYDREGGKVLFSEEHPYTVEGDWVVLHGMNEVDAHYRVVIDGDRLLFAGGAGDGKTRRVALEAVPWTRIS